MYRNLTEAERYSVQRRLKEIDTEIWQSGESDREAKRLKNKLVYNEQKKKKEDRGEMFKKLLKEGDIVKMEGTKDRLGLRLVESFNSGSITCRKLTTTRKRMGNEVVTFIVKDRYVTEHYWNKLVRIYNQDEIKLKYRIEI